MGPVTHYALVLPQGWDVDGYPDPTVHPDGAAVCRELDLGPGGVG